MNKKIAIAAVLALITSACSDTGKTTAAQTVEWYKQHEGARGAVIANCRTSPGEKAVTPDCVNAQQAQNELDNARKGLAPLVPLPKGGEDRRG